LAEVRRRRGAVQVVLAADEASTLGTLARQVAALLAGDDAPMPDDPLEAMVGLSDSVEVPDDPALRRLLPNAYNDDADAAGEFRRLMDAELRQIKTGALAELSEAAASGAGQTVTLRLDDEQSERWLQALTDIRLVVGTRLDVTEDPADMWERMEPDDPRGALLAVYDWLGWLQESILRALDS
jgi:uncharacterized protein DUF2017